MLTYAPSVQQDLRLFGWYEQIVLSGDIKRMFSLEFHSLSTFMMNVQDPVVLLHEDDEKGWWFVMWARPSYAGTADVALWIREGKRHTKEAKRAVLLGLSALLHQFPMLLAITTDATIAVEHEKVGFTPFGQLPSFGDTEGPTFITYLTRESFAAMAGVPEQATG